MGFFSGLDVLDEEISIAVNFDGRPTGDGFVRFATSNQATQALAR